MDPNQIKQLSWDDVKAVLSSVPSWVYVVLTVYTIVLLVLCMLFFASSSRKHRLLTQAHAAVKLLTAEDQDKSLQLKQKDAALAIMQEQVRDKQSSEQIKRLNLIIATLQAKRNLLEVERTKIKANLQGKTLAEIDKNITEEIKDGNP